MKLLYKIMILMIIFPVVILMVNSMNIFPNTFYSDAEVQSVYDISTTSSPESIVSTMLVPNVSFLGVGADSALTIGLIIAVFLGLGSAAAIATHSFAPVVISFMGYSFFVMMTKSMGFFNKIFNNFGGNEVIYLGICFGVGLVALVIIYIMETPTHGRGG